MPLAVPAYVGAYALVDFLEYAGPVQSALRDIMGYQSSRDYWFPQIRTPGAAAVVLSMALYPYVYILARAAFREQSGAAFEVARTLGAGPFARFWRERRFSWKLHNRHSVAIVYTDRPRKREEVSL